MRALAANTVERIIDDMRERTSFGLAWLCMSEEEREEIRQEWSRFVFEALEKATTPPSPCSSGKNS